MASGQIKSLVQRSPWLVDAIAGGVSVLIAVGTAVALWVFPDASSEGAVRHFYDTWSGLWLLVLVLLVMFFFIQLWSLGLMTAVIRRAEGEGPYSWITFGSELMFMTVFNVEIGVWATAHLLEGKIGDEALYVLHVAGFVIAAPVAFAGVAYFVAIVALQRTVKVFPRYMVIVAVVAAIGNVGAAGGLFTVSGPLNPASGLVAIGGPMLAWILWYAVVPGWYVRRQLAESSECLDYPAGALTAT